MSQWIPEFGIYDYRNRIYNSDQGRFLQADPKGFDAGDMNLFRYCADDPVDHTDPMGLETLTRPEIDEQVGNRIVQLAEYIARDTSEEFHRDPFGFILTVGTMFSHGPKIEGGPKIGVPKIEGMRVRDLDVRAFMGKHAAIRAEERNVSTEAIEDALARPLKVKPIRTDEKGPSQRYIGKSAEVVINPETGKIITMNPTPTKKAAQLLQQQAQQHEVDKHGQ